MIQKAKWNGKLKFYMEWPIFMMILLVVMDITLFTVDKKAGLIASIFTLISIILLLLLFFIYKPSVMNELVSFASQYGQVQRQMLEEFGIPYGILDTDEKVIWMNREMRTLFSKTKYYQKPVSSLLPEMQNFTYPQENETSSFDAAVGSKNFRVEIKRVGIHDWQSITDVAVIPDEESFLYCIYMFDNTEVKKYMKENEEQKLVVGLIYIDNYDEVLDSIDDVRRSLLLVLVDRKIDKFVTNHHGIVKKLEKDKYYVIMKQKYLLKMQADRFSLLEDVKTISVGNEMKITLSIGMGTHGSSYTETYEFAHAAIDLALGRGGDQAVVKSQKNISYFGGKSQQMEKNTRVRARVKAQALREIISVKDNVIVMGHKVTDIDTFGAAIGIYRASRNIGKPCHILVDRNSHSILPYLNMFDNGKDYTSDMFVNHQQAKELLGPNTVLVVVDTNRPSNTECPELLEYAKTIVVLDHHRQSSDVIVNAALSYIEPYASSACEMVTEILQYFNDGVSLPSMEADCVYAGIIVDTNNFLAKTGIRTFEAAAYLRRCGADVTRVRKLMRNDILDYKARAQAIRQAELYHSCYAISSLPDEPLDSPTIVGAQAANELLNIVGVKASFVFTRYNNLIYISARSIDEVNVQIIMERLGGGGHLNIAGAQLRDVTMAEAVEKLKDTLDTMLEEKSI